MPANHFDRASRAAAKLDPPGFLAWALGLPADGFAFGGWLDTRTVPHPGGADRTNDTVARLDPPGGTGPPWAVAVEFQAEPDPLMFGRLLVYLGGLWAGVKPDEERGSRFDVGAVVVNLTGVGLASRRMEWPAAGLGTQLDVVERNLARESADELLTAVEGGARSRALLPWVPLMTGGDGAGIIDRWKAAAAAEPGYHRRVDLAALAMVFADAADRKPIWGAALEGWNVKESATVKEWIAEGRAQGLAEKKESATVREWIREGRAEGLADSVLMVLGKKAGPVPAEVAAAVRGQPADVLERWLDHALEAADLADFLRRTGLPAAGGPG
ncbi:MAG: hypothetical protein C0501_15835 [Isosphaera sp.]|nr:hypothetical protein [Isosphaera sp.]